MTQFGTSNGAKRLSNAFFGKHHLHTHEMKMLPSLTPPFLFSVGKNRKRALSSCSLEAGSVLMWAAAPDIYKKSSRILENHSVFYLESESPSLIT